MILIASPPGQLANSVFHFGHFIACASELETTVSNPAFWRYAGLFRGSEHDPWCRWPVRPRRGQPSARRRKLLHHLVERTVAVLVRVPTGSLSASIRIDWGEKYDLESTDFRSLVDAKRLVTIQGWDLRAETWFIKHRETVKQYFSPVEVHAARIDRLEERARTECDILIGVHIRHGDYTTFEGGRHYFDLREYSDCMLRASRLFEPAKVGFLVCSNVQVEPNTLAPSDVTLGTGIAVEDLYALARCDYLIGPPSTFNMWASFYGEVPRLEMRRPFREITLEDFETLRTGSGPEATAT